MDHNKVAEVFLGAGITAVGLVVALLAIVNPSVTVSKWYEADKNKWLGLGASSRNERQYRAWHAVLGSCLFLGGIVVLILL